MTEVLAWIQPKGDPAHVDIQLDVKTDSTVLLTDPQSGQSVMAELTLESNSAPSTLSGWIRRCDTQQRTRFYAAPMGPEQLQLWVAGKTWLLKLPETVAQRRQRMQGGADAQHQGDLKAPMPGTVLKILCEPNQVVQANTPLVIMESMKMEMTLTAKAPATVTGVHTEVGQLVDMGATLVSLEALPETGA